MMKVLYDHYAFNLQRYGGVSRYFYELASRVSTSPEVDASAFLGLFLNRYGLENHKSSFRHFSGIQRPAWLEQQWRINSLNLLLLKRFMRSRTFDLLHTTYYAPSAPSGSMKRVVTVFDMIHERFPEYYSINDPTYHAKRATIEQADGIICISENTKHDLSKYFDVTTKQVSVIYLANSLDCPALEAPPLGKPYVLFVGHRTGYKNFNLLLDAWPKLQQDHQAIDLVCFGGDPFSAEDLRRLEASGLAGKAHHLTGSDTLLATLYSHAVALVYPSLYEGFGLPPLEAMYYGCPVLVSNSSSIPEVVGDAGQYFDPTSEYDLAANLNRMLSDQDLRTRLGCLGQERARRFTWSECARQTVNFYRQVLETKA